MYTSLPSSHGMKGQKILPVSWKTGSDALYIQSNLDITQTGKQVLHMLSVFWLCFGESVDPHLQLKVKTNA